MQWRRRRKIGGWCLLTRWQNQRNNFSKIFSFLWMILEAMVMNMMKISALRPLWASWACGRGWSWRRGSPSASSLFSLVTIMVLTVAFHNEDDDKKIWLGKRCFFICIQIHAFYLCMFAWLYFLYIFIGICVHSCLYFLYIFICICVHECLYFLYIFICICVHVCISFIFSAGSILFLVGPWQEVNERAGEKDFELQNFLQ